MTMRAIAADLGISIPTLYRKLKADGVNVAELRDEKTGKITPAGAAIIADLFRDSTDRTTVQRIIGGDSQCVSGDTSTQNADETIRAAVCAARLEAAEQTIARLEADLERLRTDNSRLLALLEAEAEQRQRQALLTDGRRRGGLFGWLRRGSD